MKINLFRDFLILTLGIGLGFFLGKKSEKAMQIERPFESSDFNPHAKVPKQNEIVPVRENLELSHNPESLEKPKHIVDLKDDFDHSMNTGRLDDALEVLQQMEKSNIKSKQYQESVSQYLVRTREWEKAKEALKSCLAIYPNSKSCLIDMTSAENQVGTPEEIEGAIGSCLAKMPQEPQCRNAMGVHRISGGRYEEAISIYQGLIETNGQFNLRFDESMLNWQMGVALEGAKRFEDARNYFEKACRDNFEEACRKL